MIGASSRRLQLNSNLLAGAAGLAAAAMSTAAFAADAASTSGASAPADPPKWLPSVDIGGAVGDGFTAGRVDAFVPAWQDLDSLLFVRVGVDTLTKENENFNLGLGYRTKVDPDWILGVFGGFDSSQTNLDHTFNQVSLGAELMSEDWDVHLNGYLAKKDNRPIANSYELYIHDTAIAILQGQEAAMSGFDGEVGYRVFSTDNTDVRVFAGGYSFHHGAVDTSLPGRTFDFDYQKVEGYKARAEVNIFDLDMLGPQSRLSIDGGISHDKVNNTSGYVGATLRIPLDDASGAGAQALSEIDRRMVDEPRRRDNVLTQWQYNKPEPVIIYNGTITSEPTNTLYYVDNHMGAGSYADPTTLQDATSRGPVNQFVVLTDRDGPVNATGTVVQNGETVVGPGVFNVRGVDSGRHFTHDFAPGSGPVSIYSTSGPVLTLGTDTRLYGFTIDGPFSTAIYGHNVDDVVIGNVAIHGTGGGDGIDIVEDNGSSGNVSVVDSTIDGVTNGIQFDVSNSTGSTASADLNISDSSIDAGSGVGVSVTSTVSGGSSQSTYLGIHNSIVSSGGTDVSVTGTVAAGSSLTQGVVIDPTYISGGYAGVLVEGIANGGTLTQNVGIYDVNISDTYLIGLGVIAAGTNGANVTQNVHLSNVHITNPGYIGAAFAAIGYDGATVHQYVGGHDLTIDGASAVGLAAVAVGIYNSNVTQSVALDNVTIGGGYDGMTYVEPVVQSVFADVAAFGSTANQYVNISNFDGTSAGNAGPFLSYVLGYLPIGYTQYFNPNNIGAIDAIDVAVEHATANQMVILSGTSTSSGGAAFSAIAAGGDYGTVYQFVDASGLAITGSRPVTDDGYVVYAAAIGAYGSDVSQHVLLNDVVASGGSETALFGAASLYGSFVYQGVSLSNSHFSGAYYDDIAIEGVSRYGATTHQYVDLYNVTATGSLYGDGVFIRANAHNGATTLQHVSASYLVASNDFDSGVGISATADNYYAGDSAVAAQYVEIFDSTITGNGGDGISASVSGFDDSIARQDLSVAFSNVSDNYYDGIHASASASFGGSAEQNVDLIDVTADGNGGDGAFFGADAFLLGSVQQNIYILGGEFNNNHYDGIGISASAFAAGQVLQNAEIYDITANGNGGDGLFVRTDAYGYALGTYAYYSHIGQNVIAAYDDFSHNARNGVEIYNYSGYGAQINQFVYLFGDTMNHSGPTSGPVAKGAGNGVYEYSKAEAYGYYGGAIKTNLYSDVYIVASSADYNRVDGIRISGDMDGPGYLIQHINVLGTDASYNGRSGFVAYDDATNFYSLNIQYITLANSRFSHNGLDGAAFLAYQSYGPLSFGAAIQDVTIQGSYFNDNGRDGLYASAEATDFQGRAEQHFTIEGSFFDGNAKDGASFNAFAHDGVYYPGYNCGDAQGLTGGCAFVRQTVQITNSQFDYNGRDGIYVYNTANNYGAVYNSSGRPDATPTLLVAYSDVSHNGADGVDIENKATNNSYIYSYFVALGSTFDHNGYDGIHVYSDAESGSLAIQKTILYGVPGYIASSASYNGLGDGVSIDSKATGGTVLQLVGIYGSYLIGNYDSGAKIAGHAYEPIAAGAPGFAADPTVSVVNQYVNAIGNVFAFNGVGALPGSYEGGLLVGAFAYGSHSVSQQYVTALGNLFVGNYVGLGVGGFAFYAGSTNQVVDSEHNLFLGNAVGEILIARGGVIGFATQSLYDNYNTMEYNGIGLGVVADAEAGGNVLQNLGVYHDIMSHNLYDGLALNAHANGYAFGYVLYYSHVSQNLIAAYDTFNYNGLDGIHVLNSNYYGGASNQFLYFLDVQANQNGRSGFYENSTITSIRGNSFSFSTNISSSLYLIGVTADYNGGNGIDIRSYANGATYAPAFFGGYNYMQFHNTIQGTYADHNGGNGLNMNTQTTGRYTLNAEYTTISGSNFDYNTGSGALFTSGDYYGPGGFGVSLQQTTIDGSDFSHNGVNGLELAAFASGTQGRAEQHFTITGSTMDYNGGDGLHIYASAINGTYITGHPCDTVQGLPGGCAFVRQNVVVVGSDMSNNTGNGVFVGTYANNYGAIYGASGRPHAPTLELYGDTVTYNGERGLDVSNHVSGHSYLYQYIANIDTTFDHNSSDGLYMSSYVGGGSTMLQRVLLYSYHTGSSASYNAGNGFKSTIETLGGSYARDVNIVEGVDLSNNGSFGFDGAVAYADSSSTGLQINAVYFNTINHNGDGVGLYSIGPGAQQISYIGDNEIAYNAFVGVYGEANFGAFQYIGVYTFGNNVHDNGTNYLFNAFGGSTQILN